MTIHFCEPCHRAAIETPEYLLTPTHYCEPTCRRSDCFKPCECGLPHGTPLERHMARVVLGRLAALDHSQAWLAENLDVSQKHVSRVLHMRNGASFAWWQQAAECLGIDWVGVLALGGAS